MILSGCASTRTNENFTEPGPHYLKAPDDKEVQTIGKVVGMLEGTLVGLAAGLCAGILTYNGFYGRPDSADKPNVAVWLSISSLIFMVPGGIIGWNIPYGIIGMPTEADKKRELEKKQDEKIKNIFKDKNAQ